MFTNINGLQGVYTIYNKLSHVTRFPCGKLVLSEYLTIITLNTPINQKLAKFHSVTMYETFLPLTSVQRRMQFSNQAIASTSHNKCHLNRWFYIIALSPMAFRSLKLGGHICLRQYDWQLGWCNKIVVQISTARLCVVAMALVHNTTN